MTNMNDVQFLKQQWIEVVDLTGQTCLVNVDNILHIKSGDEVFSAQVILRDAVIVLASGEFEKIHRQLSSPISILTSK